jgi:hypothetical protein
MDATLTCKILPHAGKHGNARDLCFKAASELLESHAMNLAKPILATLLLSSIAAIAAPIYWINPGQGQFTDIANWSSNSVPTGSDDARVNNGGTAVIDSSMTLSMSLLQIGDTNTTTGTVRMTGGSLTLASDLRAGGNAATAGGTGVFQLEGGTAVVSGGNFNVGFGTNNANGTYNIFGGSLQCNAANPIFAVGNRGTGTVNQTNGTVFLKNTTGITQLGRNVANGLAFGTYTLSGGTLACGRVLFGNAVQTNGISTNTFTLSGTGVVICNTISNINTTAVNSFNFNGGTLTVTNCAISLTNNGGVLSPGTPDFANAGATSIAALPINPIGTTTFNSGTSYFQGDGGTLAIDIAGPGLNDMLKTYSSGAPSVATIAGTIRVNLLNNFVPDLGSTFDIVAGNLIVNTATIVGNNGAAYSAAIVSDGAGGQILRLTVTAQPVVPPVLTATLLGNGMFRMTFTNTPGHLFTAVGTTNVAYSFSDVALVSETSPGQYQFTDTQTATTPQRYWRVRSP